MSRVVYFKCCAVWIWMRGVYNLSISNSAAPPYSFVWT